MSKLVKLIIWNNQGARSEHPVASGPVGLKVARENRTMANRTVKLADAFGSTHHWSRSTGLFRNHWTARAVADEGFF